MQRKHPCTETSTHTTTQRHRPDECETRSSPLVFFIQFFSAELWNKRFRLNGSHSHWLIRLPSFSFFSISLCSVSHLSRTRSCRSLRSGRRTRMEKWGGLTCRGFYNRKATTYTLMIIIYFHSNSTTPATESYVCVCWTKPVPSGPTHGAHVVSISLCTFITCVW